MSFNDLFLSSSDDAKVKLPRGFGASSSEGAVVELETNNDLGSNLIYLEMYDKDSAAEILTKKTVKNFLKYVKNDLYDNSILHRSVPGFVLQGGGFVAPSAPSSEGGVPVPINSYGTVKNQPGNSNLRGTIAMAKIAGDPDSATSQWYINLEDNISLDSQNEGFTVFGHVMGDGMSVVDDLSSANVYNFGDVFSQLPLWELESDSSGGIDVRPEDFLVITSAAKTKTKKQPFDLIVSSSDPDLVDVKIGRKQAIKIDVANSGSGVAEITVEATSLLDGTTHQDSFDVVVGEDARSGARSKDSKKKSKKIDVYVGNSSLEYPFYGFFDVDGDEITDFKINVKKKYVFHRLNADESHPFYVGDSGYGKASTNAVKIKGDGRFDEGITGVDSFTFRVRKSERQAFKEAGDLSFFCTSHASMVGTFAIKGQKDFSIFEPIVNFDQGSQSDISPPVVDESGSYDRMVADSVDQFPLI